MKKEEEKPDGGDDQRKHLREFNLGISREHHLNRANERQNNIVSFYYLKYSQADHGTTTNGQLRKCESKNNHNFDFC